MDVSWGIICIGSMNHLFLDELELFGLEQLLWNTLGVTLRAQTKLP